MTEEEREMLELAAKAAGYEVSECTCKKEIRVSVSPRRYAHWNPLEDDGDALRLAVRLGMCVDVRQAHTEVTPPGDRYTESEEHEDDPEAATRRAIFRAAVEIGRRM